MNYLFFKRLIDFIASFILFILLLMPFIIIAILIKLDSKGSVFYRQVRIGQNCKEFKIFKFRTMVSNADQIGGYSTSKNDNRITKIGQFLRKTSLDELPQVINVILGNMSLIGPRPDVPAQKINYIEKEWIKDITLDLVLQDLHSVEIDTILQIVQERNMIYFIIKK